MQMCMWLINGSPVFDSALDSSSGDQGIDQFYDLNPGDTVQFAVGYGANKNLQS